MQVYQGFILTAFQDCIGQCDHEKPFRWNLGRLALGHVVIIFIYINIYLWKLHHPMSSVWHQLSKPLHGEISLDMFIIFTNPWRCPWCSRYRRRKWTWRHEFKFWTTLIAFYIALIPLGKVWIQLFSLQLWVNCRADYVLQPWWGN